MNPKILGAGIVAIIILIAAFFLSKDAKAPTPEDIESANDDHAAEEADSIPFEEIDDGAEEASPEAEEPVASKPTTDTTVTTPASTPTPTPAPAPTPSTPASNEPNFPTNVTVVYDGGRFIPEDVVTIVGGTVRFVNISDTQMWIGSDNHPTHTRYYKKTENDCLGSAFDQCESVGKGESWTFMFDREGTWGYHNHKRAKDDGKVIVMTKENYLESI